MAAREGAGGMDTAGACDLDYKYPGPMPGPGHYWNACQCLCVHKVPTSFTS